MMPYIAVALGIIIIALGVWFIKILLDIRKITEPVIPYPTEDNATKAFLEDTIVDTEAPIKG